jgi:hypothetical protein
MDALDGPWRVQRESQPVSRRLDGGDAADLFDDSGEHQ